MFVYARNITWSSASGHAKDVSLSAWTVEWPLLERKARFVGPSEIGETCSSGPPPAQCRNFIRLFTGQDCMGSPFPPKRRLRSQALNVVKR